MTHPSSDISFSVILPTKDRPEDLGNALKSLAAQTHENFEIVVVNDGYNDIRQVVEASPVAQASIPVQYVWGASETGPSAARNRGLEVARGDVVAYLDDDDFYKPNHLEVHAEKHIEQSSDVVYSDAARCRIAKQPTGDISVDTEVVLSREFDADRLMVSNYIPMLSLSHRRECLDDSGWFEESLSSLVDWDLFIRLSQHFTFTHVPEVTAVYVEKELGDSVQECNRSRFLQNLDTVYGRTDEFLKEDPKREERVWNMRLNHVANMMFETGQHMEESGALTEALELYTRAIQTDVQPQYYLAQARVQKSLGMRKEALIATHLAQQCRDLEI